MMMRNIFTITTLVLASCFDQSSAKFFKTTRMHAPRKLQSSGATGQVGSNETTTGQSTSVVSTEPIQLTMGETSENFKIRPGQSQLLTLDVTPGTIVECHESEDYFLVYLRFNEPANPFNYQYDCGGNFLNWCHAADDFGNATTLYVTVESPPSYVGVTNVTCNTVEPISLTESQPSDPFLLKDEIKVFELDLADPAETVRCEVQGEATDYTFFTRFDAVPNLRTLEYDCSGGPNVPCVVKASDNSKLNFLVIGSDSQELTVVCSEVIPVPPADLAIGTMTDPFQVQPGLSRTFILTVDPQTQDNVVCSTTALTGDVDLAMEVGKEPNEDDFNCLSGGMTANESCNVTISSITAANARSSGTTVQVYATVMGFSDAKNVTLVCNVCDPKISFDSRGALVWMFDGVKADSIVMDKSTVHCRPDGSVENTGADGTSSYGTPQEMPTSDGSGSSNEGGAASSATSMSVLFFSAAGVVGAMLCI